MPRKRTKLNAAPCPTSRGNRARIIAATILAVCLLMPAGRSEELITDGHFQRGFILWNPKPGGHQRDGELGGFDNSAAPAWGLCQWNSRFPLAGKTLPEAEALVCSNAAKLVEIGRAGTAAADLVLSLNTGVEYQPSRKSAAEPWVHLLAEQEFDRLEPLDALASARLHVEARLVRSELLRTKDYSPAIHAAQFQIFFTVQNRNRQSSGYGDLLWFGVPLYDNRSRFPAAFKEQDFGGTFKFIFTPEGRVFSDHSLQDGAWVTIDKDLLPLMQEGLETAWERGFLKGSQSRSDYSISGMNLGWELPGTFVVSMQIRNLSLNAIHKAGNLK